MTNFEELLTDKEFLLHWKECWPKLHEALLQMQLEWKPSQTMTYDEIGRRSTFLQELRSKLEPLASHQPEVGGKTPRRKLHQQHFRPGPIPSQAQP